jgi:hypothetical protein
MYGDSTVTDFASFRWLSTRTCDGDGQYRRARKGTGPCAAMSRECCVAGAHQGRLCGTSVRRHRRGASGRNPDTCLTARCLVRSTTVQARGQSRLSILPGPRAV